MLRAVIFSLVLSLSAQTFARRTIGHKNARLIFHKKMKELKAEALKVLYFPPLSIPRFIKYNHCKQVYFYFKSAYVLSHKSKHSKLQISNAKRRLTRLLEQLKQETEKVKDVRLHTLDAKNNAQKQMNSRIEHMTLGALIHILLSADKIIPKVLIYPESNEIKYDSEIFRETLRTVSNDPSFYGKSIFEASVLKEEAEIRRNRAAYHNS